MPRGGAQKRSSFDNPTLFEEQEEDGRWLAEVLELPGVLAYGESPHIALWRARAGQIGPECWPELLSELA